jgi:D-apiose dehydrogenase
MVFRVAVAGAGYFSRFHQEAWTRIPQTLLVGIADQDLAKAQAAAAAHGTTPGFATIEAMLDAVRPDILDIATPPHTHAAVIATAAARGIAVICQKPFCQTMIEAEAACSVAEKAGIPLVVHENFRFQPWHSEIARLITQGAVGQVYQASFRLRPGDGQGPSAYMDRQPYFQSMERFLIHETAIHLIDVFRFLFGEVAHVYADLRRVNPVIAGEDAGIVVLTMANGIRALFDGNRCSDHIAENRRLTMGEMLVEGSSGIIRLDGSGRLFRRSHGSNVETEHHYSWQDIGFAGDCVKRTLEAIIEALAEDRKPPNTGRAYLANLAVEAAIYRSQEEGRRVAL